MYSKYFKGSVPEYVAITVEPDGKATYQEAKEDDNPIRIQLSASDAQTLFDLAAKLDHFQHPLESGLKVANMGVKTFAFTDGARPARGSIQLLDGRKRQGAAGLVRAHRRKRRALHQPGSHACTTTSSA